MEILPLDLERDYQGIDRLLEKEEWPFTRADLEVSHQQPKATSFVARHGGNLEGFFTTHNFLDVGYLDMMVVQAGYRKMGVARRLYVATMEALRAKGIQSFVVHTTNESFPLIRLLKFKAGVSFTLLARDPGGARGVSPAPADLVRCLDREDFPALVELDERIFGASREAWILSLLSQPEVHFYGLSEGNGLAASLCLRPRKGGAVCLDAAHADDLKSLLQVTDSVLAAHSHSRVECFVRTGSDYHEELLRRGFTVPEFFRNIGPLVEWRKGPVGPLGLSQKVRCLVWL